MESTGQVILPPPHWRTMVPRKVALAPLTMAGKAMLSMSLPKATKFPESDAATGPELPQFKVQPVAKSRELSTTAQRTGTASSKTAFSSMLF